MPYLGKSPQHGNYSKLDDFSGDFDGSDATHAVASNSIAITPVRPEALIISINGVLQEPVTDYTVSGTNITFTTAPTAGDNFFGVALGEQLAIGTPSDATITSAKLTGNLVTPGTLDVNGQELILDADGDTTITADTDDQIDIKIAGADDFQFTANTFTAQSGSTIAAQALTATTIGSSGGVTITGTTPTLTIGDAGAEDAKIVFDGNAQDFHIGLDDTADDLVIGLGSALGTTTHMAFDETGAIIKPLQPAFSVLPASQQANFALDSDVTVVFGTEVFDQNADFASNTFTAPVAGKYLLTYMIGLANMDSASNYYRTRLITSNRNYDDLMDPDFGQDPAYWWIKASHVVDMDASDTAYIQIRQASGTQQTDVETDSYFTGCLLA